MLSRCSAGVSTQEADVRLCDVEWKTLSRKSTLHLSFKTNSCLASSKALQLSTGQKTAQMWTCLNLRGKQGKDDNDVTSTRQKQLTDPLESGQIKALGPSSLRCSTQKGHQGQPHSRLLASLAQGWLGTLPSGSSRPSMWEVRLADGCVICDSGLKLSTLWNGTISKWSYFQKSLRSFIDVVLHVNILTAPFAKIGSGREGWVISQAWFSPCCQGQQTAVFLMYPGGGRVAIVTQDFLLVAFPPLCLRGWKKKKKLVLGEI